MSLHSGMETATNAASMRLRRESPRGSVDVLPSSSFDPSEGASSLSPDARTGAAARRAREEARATRRDATTRGVARAPRLATTSDAAAIVRGVSDDNER
jgi:hypothetical protein